MKKLMVMISLVLAAAAAEASVGWSWWLENDSPVDVSFGLASRRSKVSVFELNLLYGGSDVERGVQFSFLGINDSDNAQVLQLAPWFNRGDEACVQLGFVNMAKNNVFTLGFINVADTSKVQLGLLNFNKNGFLPVFPFINLDKSLFE